ncbi:hypothetical protein METHP14_1140013 [Pseudomonas sp. P14-2025]
MRLQNFAKAPILAVRQKKRSIDRYRDGICKPENATRALPDRQEETHGAYVKFCSRREMLSQLN